MAIEELGQSVIQNSFRETKIAFRLSRSDYFHKWVFRIKQFLVRMSMWLREMDEPKEGSLCFSVTIQNIHEDHLDLIIDLTSAQEAWAKLKKKFSSPPSHNQIFPTRGTPIQHIETQTPFPRHAKGV